MNGIDISEHQRNINLSLVQCDFVIVKATEGKTYTDPQFLKHIESARNLGKLLGFYHFARPENNTPHEEVLNFLASVTPYLGEGIPFLDWESNGKNNTSWAKEWLDEFYQLTGIRPIIYMSESVTKTYDWSKVAPEYKLWVAKYRDYEIDYNYDMTRAGNPPKVGYWSSYVMWQWTSSGRIDGYPNNLDCNQFYGTREDWIKLTERDEKPMPEYKYIEVLSGVATYSKREVGDYFFTIDGRVSNFQVKEFACHDGTNEILIDGNLVRRLQDCRDKFGVTIINSAYRTPDYNKKIGGATNSQHVKGKASDTVCRGTSPLEVAMYAEAIGMGGIGLYNDFTHIDTRDIKARWDNRSGKEVGVSTFLKTVKLLSTGNEVRIAQKYLGVTVDGIFGPNTRKATIAFQHDHKLDEDGVIGVQTWTKLLTR
jgi:GH25 family lysozyme M1 (1,4-beta-N-acetylmuramidase)